MTTFLVFLKNLASLSRGKQSNYKQLLKPFAKNCHIINKQP